MSQTTNGLMTASELAKYLGVHVRTIYRWLKEPGVGLPVIRMEGPKGRVMLRFERDKIERWLSGPVVDRKD